MVEYGDYLVNLRNIINKHWIPALLEKDEDRVVIIEGKEGSSKSTLALHLANIFMARQNKEFNVKKIHYSVGSFISSILASNKGDIQMIDEGALLGFSRDAMTKNTKSLVKVLTSCRSKNNLILICIPNINLLDRYLREHRVSAVLKVTKKGMVDIYHYTTYKKATYKEKFSKKFKLKRSSMRDSYPKFEKLYGGDKWDEYLKHKHKELEKDKPKVLNKKALEDEFILNLYSGGLNQREIGEVLNRSKSTIGDAIQRARHRKQS